MKGHKKTKKALLASILSLVLCCAMLIGTTFAWFTDSAQSGINSIASGNLDIALSYLNATAGAQWTEVTPAADDLFVNPDGSDILWEPGAVSVVYLELKNLGNLAIKYQLAVSFEDIVTGSDGAALSEVLKTAVVELAEAPSADYYTRAAAIAAAENAQAEPLRNYALNGSMTAANEVKYLAMIIYFPQEVGNTFQGKLYNTSEVSLATNLGLSLVATQFTSEYDSIDNQYDLNAVYPVFAKSTKPITKDADNKLTGEAVVIQSANTVEIGNGVSKPVAKATVPPEVQLEPDATALTLEVVKSDTPDGFIVSDGKLAATYDVTVHGVAATNDKYLTVELFLGKDLINVALSHVSGEGTLVLSPVSVLSGVNQFVYDAETGFVSFTTNSFSDFVFEYIDPSILWVSSEAELVNAVSVATSKHIIRAKNDLAISNTLIIPAGKTVAIDLNQKTLSREDGDGIHNAGNLLVKNGTIATTGSEDIGIVTSSDLETEALTINSFICISLARENPDVACDADIVINSGRYISRSDIFTLKVAVPEPDSRLVINGGSFKIAPNGSDPAVAILSMPAGMTLQEDAEGLYSLQEAQNAAIVDGVEYADVLTALTAGTTSSKPVTLLSNCQINSANTRFTVTTGQALTIDLNGKTLTWDTSGDTSFASKNGVRFEIAGGTFVIKDTSATKTGKLLIICPADFNQNAISVYSSRINNTSSAGDGVMRLEGGEIACVALPANRSVISSSYTGTQLIITGGSITAVDSTAAVCSTYNNYMFGTGSITVSGGSFSSDPTAYVAAGCSVSAVNGRWVVTQS